jgi:thiol-disulfide isomerase/thioredoxin
MDAAMDGKVPTLLRTLRGLRAFAPALVASIALLTATDAFAHGDSACAKEDCLVGKEAPEIETSQWLGSDGRTRLADLKGQVVLVEVFATSCTHCRGVISQLNRFQTELGRKGFRLLSITRESRETVMKFMAQLNSTPIDYTIGVGGGTDRFQSTTIPNAWLVSAEGKVIWQGSPAALTEKTIETELKKIPKSPANDSEARAAKTLERAEALVAEKRVAEAVEALRALGRDKVLKGTESAAKAEVRATEIEKDENLKAELNAQRDLARLVGGNLDRPREKMKPRERGVAAVRLESFIKTNGESAPAATAMAETWLKVMREDWRREE